ncbi:ribonuclease H family protein [Lacticaseibacillus paracasei]|uniref:ribonuclease H family protein n=1 Tax=Lacticaseibacillus paracasei TaxID=1597 RepID=UPI00189296EB|nr:ribonuclease H [Lacticaseibacillus paracasei]MCT4386071.1 ribonuclease HI [Lacticaseibacillus paracasei]MDC6272877.1 ribonuclease HI [Lacticaseibacillus paracasei]MDN4553586.1 ribonuclease H [Lacticaseibacillus paracasei]MDP0529494.1 ribonuclease HI [Lacticaseibacillus paracasei]MDT8952191.1 ribonuclease H [Lacticaseibacillus paracasei subsp. paracasei]
MAESIVLYTDGGNRNTGNQAGGSVRPTDKSAWAALLIYGDHEKMLSDGDYGRTNNYMEIMAVIQGLKALKRTDIPVDVYSDSAYVINTMQQRWWVKWQQNNWRNHGKPVKNAALWQALLQQVDRFETINFHKVKGHATNRNNNRVDAALNQTMDQLDDHV